MTLEDFYRVVARQLRLERIRVKAAAHVVAQDRPLWKYACTESRASACKVVLPRNTRGAQSAFGYIRPSSPNTGRRNASGSGCRHSLFHHVQPVSTISTEAFVAAVARQRDRHVLAGQLTNPVGRDCRAVRHGSSYRRASRSIKSKSSLSTRSTLSAGGIAAPLAAHAGTHRIAHRKTKLSTY